MREPAYAIPFDVQQHGHTLTIRNAGDEPVPWMRVDLVGAGVMTPISPGRLDPGGEVTTRLGGDVARASRLQLTWLRADGSGPYVWLRGL